MEIGEVETALSKVEGVAEVAVVTKPHEKYGNTLHAFIVQKGAALPPEEVKNRLAQLVPSYMIPF